MGLIDSYTARALLRWRLSPTPEQARERARCVQEMRKAHDRMHGMTLALALRREVLPLPWWRRLLRLVWR